MLGQSSSSAAAGPSQARQTAKKGALIDADPVEPIRGDAAAAQQELGIRDGSRARKAAAATPSAPPKGWPHFVAGGIGGMCGAIVTSPLDVVKTRLQSDMYTSKYKKQLATASQSKGVFASLGRLAYNFVETAHLLKEITQKEGARALFRGLGPTLVGVIPARSINFYTYGNGKILLADKLNEGQEVAAIHLSAAAIAGIVTATATNPIWVIKTRLQLEHHAAETAAKVARQEAVGMQKTQAATRNVGGSRTLSTTSQNMKPTSNAFSATPGFFKAGPSPARPSTNSFTMAMTILRTEGIAGMYRGITASYLGVAEGTIQWTLYEQFKRMSLPREGDSEAAKQARSMAGTVGAAGTAKMIASLITYPHEVLRTRMRQAPPEGQQPKYTGLLQTLKLIVREEGAGKLYGGLSAHLLRVVPNAAIMFVMYEWVLAMSKKET